MAMRKLLSFAGFSVLTYKMDTAVTAVRVSGMMSGKAPCEFLYDRASGHKFIKSRVLWAKR